MKKAVIYIHGKGGNVEEAQHYQRFFLGVPVIGFDYRAETPWDAMVEFNEFFADLQNTYDSISIIANSIGAYFALNAFESQQVETAWLISPVVDMEKLITDMMMWASVTEEELEKKRIINTNFGETLSMDYLTWVREHPITWEAPTRILYGSSDKLQSIETIKAFAQQTGAELTVMEGGEHWFHTKEQMTFLDGWIESCMIRRMA